MKKSQARTSVAIALVVSVSLGWATQHNSQVPLFAPAPGSPITVGPGSGTIILADVSGDGHLDMVTRHLMSRRVTVLLGDGKGGFAVAAGSPIVLGYSPGDIKLGDLNNDKIPDLGVTSSEKDNVDIFLGKGKGGFSLAPGSPFTASASAEFFTRFLHLVDINEDGNLDIITATDGRLVVNEVVTGTGFLLELLFRSSLIPRALERTAPFQNHANFSHDGQMTMADQPAYAALQTLAQGSAKTNNAVPAVIATCCLPSIRKLIGLAAIKPPV